MSTVNDRGMFSQEKIVLRSVYSKTPIKYYMQPCKDKYGRLPECVKKVNSQGDMILSDAERNSEGAQYFIPENQVFVIMDGQEFDLTDPYEKNMWEAIKNNPLIAKSRFEKDENGNYKIDGTMDKNSNKQRYGIAELYVDMPGVEVAQKVSKKKKVLNACRFIMDDPRGADGRIIMTKLLGKPMRNAPDADVEDFLFQCAEKDPDKIISLYAGEDLNLRILFADARERKVITVKNRLYVYVSADVILGHTDDAVITWMKDAKNKKVLDLIRKDTYPEMEVAKKS